MGGGTGTSSAQFLRGLFRHRARAPGRPSLIEPILLLKGDRTQPRNLRNCADQTFEFLQLNLVIEPCHPDRLEVGPRDEADVGVIPPQARGRRSPFPMPLHETVLDFLHSIPLEGLGQTGSVEESDPGVVYFEPPWCAPMKRRAKYPDQCQPYEKESPSERVGRLGQANRNA